MKELSIEDKVYYINYKTYTELINRLEDVKEAIKKQNYGIAMDILCKPYPQFQVITHTELKESEDERIRKEVIELVDGIYKDSYTVSAKEERDRYVAWLEKQGEKGTKGNEGEIPFYEQKPAWSKEDEVKINRIVACLENLNVADNDILLKDVDWLKNLKDRYTWKPSDEQIEAFEHFVRSIGESGYSSPYDDNTKLLYSLLEDLKKLRG